METPAAEFDQRVRGVAERGGVDVSKPFVFALEGEYRSIRGKAVGIYAKDAVGTLTHPATSMHLHLTFKDEASGETVTGHVERMGLVKGASIKAPQ